MSRLPISMDRYESALHQALGLSAAQIEDQIRAESISPPYEARRLRSMILAQLRVSAQRHEQTKFGDDLLALLRLD